MRFTGIDIDWPIYIYSLFTNLIIYIYKDINLI
jgi:hypothetical protein